MANRTKPSHEGAPAVVIIQLGCLLLAFLWLPGEAGARPIPQSAWRANALECTDVELCRAAIFRVDDKSEAERTQKRRDAALKFFQENPDSIPEKFRQPILDGQVVLGMTPNAARLAGGAFAYQVIADPKNWTPNSDPLEVMSSQSVRPDKSQIYMTFQNTTQYPGEELQRFKVTVQAGQVVEIEQLRK